jgi:hypothetical protein
VLATLGVNKLRGTLISRTSRSSPAARRSPRTSGSSSRTTRSTTWARPRSRPTRRA